MRCRGALERSGIVCTVLLALGALFFPAAAQGTIRYDVSLAQPAQPLFHVAIPFPTVHGNVTLQLPAWDALYQIRDFASRVTDFQAAASSPAGNVRASRVDKQTWNIVVEGAADAEVRVRYAVYWDEPGPFATQLNAQH